MVVFYPLQISTKEASGLWLVASGFRGRDAARAGPSVLCAADVNREMLHDAIPSCSKGSHQNVNRYTQEGRLEMGLKRYPLVIEPTSTGYSAFSPDVPGCAAVGDTEEETRRNFQDALAAHFEAMREIGEPIPEPRTSVDYVEVAA
jgi:predicted RNase H-like HicB family nuclease